MCVRIRTYSPRIDSRLIPALYRLRVYRKVPMTRLVHQLLLKALSTETNIPEEVKTMLAGLVGGAVNRAVNREEEAA
jgi:hypothetical protein